MLQYHCVKAELQEQEDLLYRERKARERVITGYRRKVEEYKTRAEKVDRRVRTKCCSMVIKGRFFSMVGHVS